MISKPFQIQHSVYDVGALVRISTHGLRSKLPTNAATLDAAQKHVARYGFNTDTQTYCGLEMG